MKILFDHQIFSTQIYGGVSRYFYELMKNFENDNEIEYELSLRYSNNLYLRGLRNVACKSFFEDFTFRGKYRILNFLNKKISKKFISKGNYDIFHPTYYNPYFFNFLNNKPFVLTIHDMIQEIFPENFSNKDKISEYKKILASKASKIIAVSQNTKNDIIKFYSIDEAKIDVVYHGSFSPITNDIRNENIKFKLPEKFILFVGNRGGYKNFTNFMKSVSLLLKNDQNLFVVCAGGGNFNKYEQDLLKNLSLQERVFQFSVDDEELWILYKNALVFVFPSLYEGFGLPILEAFACKCPIVVSNSSCFPEIAGEAAEYFDPLSTESMKSSIEKVVYNNNIRMELIKRGINRVRGFSWQKTAEKTKEVYQSLV